MDVENVCELKGYSVQNRMDLDRPKQSEDTETAEQKVWFVTGTSRGLGRALAEEVLRRGDVLMATARKNDLQRLVDSYKDRVKVASLDVVRPKAALDVVEDAVQQFGRIDVVVNNAGYGFMAAFEEITTEQFAHQIDTNFWGTVHVCRAVLPFLRAQRAGHIMNITSIGDAAAARDYRDIRRPTSQSRASAKCCFTNSNRSTSK